MEEERDNGGMDLQLRRLSLIDFSSENDSLVLSSISSPLTTSAGLDHDQPTEKQMQPEVFESLGGGSISGGKDSILIPSSDQDDQFPDLKESMEPDCFRRKAKCNLRKSLAWDSAFFTSAGVLDPEELSCMIKGAEKSDKKMLPGIEEDFRRSDDSISTLESDNLVMENLEAELFGDIRASIQKSSQAFTATSETSNKKLNASSPNQKRQSTYKKPISISKPQINQTPRTYGTTRAVNQDAIRSQAVQHVARPGNLNPELHNKPPRVISNGNPTSTITSKRASLAATDTNKIGPAKSTLGAVAGKVPQASKANVLSGARRLLPKSTSSSKGASIDSSNSSKSTKSFPTGSSGRVSTEKVPKSLLAPVQRKVAVRTVNLPSAGSSIKTPLKTESRNKTTSGNSAVSAYLMSSKISSSISPSSSISEWSSASSSSSCTANLRSKSRTSFETSSCRSSVNEITSDFSDDYSFQLFDKDESDGKTVSDRSARKSKMQSSTLYHSDSARPSGLRLPSPKIGFFDGVKAIRTPNGSQQSHASLTTLPTVGAAVPSPRSSNMKPKFGKLSHPRAASALPKIKPQAENVVINEVKDRKDLVVNDTCEPIVEKL